MSWALPVPTFFGIKGYLCPPLTTLYTHKKGLLKPQGISTGRISYIYASLPWGGINEVECVT